MIGDSARGRGAKGLIADRLLLEARRRLLYSDESVGRIAGALGFRDPSYFSRFFRAKTGRSPRQFLIDNKGSAGVFWAETMGVPVP